MTVGSGGCNKDLSRQIISIAPTSVSGLVSDLSDIEIGDSVLFRSSSITYNSGDTSATLRSGNFTCVTKTTSITFVGSCKLSSSEVVVGLTVDLPNNKVYYVGYASATEISSLSSFVDGIKIKYS